MIDALGWIQLRIQIEFTDRIVNNIHLPWEGGGSCFDFYITPKYI